MASSTAAPPDWSAPHTWTARYAARPGTHDWYIDAAALLPSVAPLLSRADDFEVLIPGCGTSALPAALYAAGFRNLSCIDRCAGVVAAMAARYAELADMDYSVLDATALGDALPDACFDLVLDKALLDALACGRGGGGGGSAAAGAPALVAEMHRVLKPGGRYCVVSHAPPEARLPYLAAPQLGWQPRVTELRGRGGKPCFLYVCTKPDL